MVEQTTKLIVSRLDTMSDKEREQVLCALLNRYCVGCGRSGDWSGSPCDCEPGQCAKPVEPQQLWLTYKAA